MPESPQSPLSASDVELLMTGRKRIAELEKRIADMAEAHKLNVKWLEAEIDELGSQNKDAEERIEELEEQVEASHKEIKRIGDSSRALQAELDERDCELAEVREHMKELLHGYLAENARANKAGTELLKKLEAQEEEEARQAGEDMMKAMAGTPMVPAEPEVTYIGRIDTESASFKRYIASLSEEERREIFPTDCTTR